MTIHAKPEEPVQGPVRERHAELAADVAAAIEDAERMIAEARAGRDEALDAFSIELDADTAAARQRTAAYPTEWIGHINAYCDEASAIAFSMCSQRFLMAEVVA